MTRTRTLLTVLLLLGALLASIILVHNALTEPYPGLNDFMSRWEGARSYWIDGLNPYGEQASLNIQNRIYGGPAPDGLDPGYFAYPFYTVFVIWPLVYLPYAWASAVWLVLLAAGLIAALTLLLNLFGWRPAPWLLAALILWNLVFYFSARGLILGQPGVLVYVLEILALWALLRQRDTLAGAALALSTFKPQMGFLIVPFLLLWALRMRRWRFIVTFTGVMAALLLASFLLQPAWLGDWIAQIQLYPSYTALGSPVWIITNYYLGGGALSEWAVNLPLYGLMLWAWFTALRSPESGRFMWTTALTLTITHLAAPRTATPHYVVFILPLIFYCAYLSRHHRRRASLWIAGILALLLVIPWLHFLATVEGRFEHPTVYLPLPFGFLLLLWLTRRWWWQTAPGEQTAEAAS